MIKKKVSAKKKAPTKTSMNKSPKFKKAGAKKSTRMRNSGKKEPILLSGGNPQIAKGYGDGPVQEYIAAMPGWKKEIGRKLDELIVRTVPHVSKAVKWNSPLYGIEGQGWFLGVHVFAKYVKIAFFKGASLKPMPPGSSKVPGTRYLDIREEDGIDEAQLSSWIKQASELPGEKL
ncbi:MULTISPECIES: DUF1801 domain-containing protein [unclassified Leptospira]|uniref:DUF1801 domain-containing protein n=1 Tax=unclassified Leptospira TaxID=2633828 RepID=UPI0002BE0463|nr:MULTISPECIES: DUF1801 domain-containing protein [unclassified Leptospira]EMJ97414.1 PF08818 domain protein [Leptospira sp. B5-022]MCR1793298.1 DUF1801 domain-containing protein [Leptospira sp. id769339]